MRYIPKWLVPWTINNKTTVLFSNLYRSSNCVEPDLSDSSRPKHYKINLHETFLQIILISTQYHRKSSPNKYAAPSKGRCYTWRWVFYYEALGPQHTMIQMHHIVTVWPVNCPPCSKSLINMGCTCLQNVRECPRSNVFWQDPECSDTLRHGIFYVLRLYSFSSVLLCWGL